MPVARHGARTARALGTQCGSNQRFEKVCLVKFYFKCVQQGYRHCVPMGRNVRLVFWATGIASRWDETFWRYDALIYAKLLIPILLKIKII